MDLNADASIPTAAPGAEEEEHQQKQSEQETSQQPGTESDLTAISSQPIKNQQQDPIPATTPTPAVDSAPSQDAPRQDHLTVIDEKMEISKKHLINKYFLVLRFACLLNSLFLKYTLYNYGKGEGVYGLHCDHIHTSCPFCL